MDRTQQVIVNTLGLRANCMECPRCGGKTTVYKTRSPKRNRKCLTCDYRYVTQEVHQSEVDRLIDMVDTALDLFNGDQNEQRTSVS
jgi:transposase-like protein